MGAFASWSVAVGLALALVLGLHHLGYDVSVGVGDTLRALEHVLGQPLLPP